MSAILALIHPGKTEGFNHRLSHDDHGISSVHLFQLIDRIHQIRFKLFLSYCFVNLIFGRSPYFHIEFFYFFRKPIYLKYFHEIGTQEKVEEHQEQQIMLENSLLLLYIVNLPFGTF